jgi:hypothetical protein
VYNFFTGQSASATAITESAKTVATVGEFAVTGNVADLDKTELAKAAGTDAVKNAGLGIMAAIKGAKTVAAVATVSDEQLQATQEDLDRLKSQAVDGLAVSTAVGVGAAATLDAVALMVPHPAVKIAAVVGKVGLTAGGFIHNADEMVKLTKQFENPASAETGKTLIRQMDEANKANRPL